MNFGTFAEKIVENGCCVLDLDVDSNKYSFMVRIYQLFNGVNLRYRGVKESV